MTRSLIIAALAACSGSRTGAPTDAAISSDAMAYPAFHPSMPQIEPAGRPPLVMATPTIQVVYFAGETRQATIDPVLADYAASDVFSAELGEYSVRSTTFEPAVTVAAAAPGKVAETDVDAFITSELDGTHPEIGPVDSATIATKAFILIYPAATTVTQGGVSLCTSGVTAYHRDVALDTGVRAQVGVVPTCGSSAPIAGAAYAMVAIATDPLVGQQPQGWAGFTATYANTEAFGGELASACSDSAAMVDGNPVGKIWSNADSAAYHDPCLPADPSPYFIAVPLATDPVDGGLGVAITIGSATTMTLDFISDGPTTGPWTVAAVPVGDVSATFSFDQPSGQNGDAVRVEVSAQAATDGVVDIVSTLGSVSHTWPLRVQAH